MISQTCLILPGWMPSPSRCAEKPPHGASPAVDAVVDSVASSAPDRAAPTTPATNTLRRSPGLRRGRCISRPLPTRDNSLPFIALQHLQLVVDVAMASLRPD